MNDSEKRAFNWLTEQGYSGLVFQHSVSPDFTSASGDKFEIKKVRNNVIWFSPNQYRTLKDMGGVKVVVMNGEDEPVLVAPFSAIRNGYLGSIKVSGTEGTRRMIGIHVADDVWQKAKVAAAQEGVTLQAWLTLAILLKVNLATLPDTDNIEVVTWESGGP